MAGERSEVTTTSGCVYEGVCHVITPGDPAAGGTRGMYQVRSLFTVLLAGSFRSSSRVHTLLGKKKVEEATNAGTYLMYTQLFMKYHTTMYTDGTRIVLIEHFFLLMFL